jgi:hypothetical protein
LIGTLSAPDRLGLSGVDPHLPSAGGRVSRIEEPVRPPAAELRLAQVRHAAEHRGDPPPGPDDRILDRSERPRTVRGGGQTVEQRSHQVAAAVVKAPDLAGIVHRVLGCMLWQAHHVQPRHFSSVQDNPDQC